MIKIGNRTIGPEYPCFITFEAGPTHNGFDSAKRLIKAAAEAGADAIKFQILDPDRLISDKKQLFSYDILVDRQSGKTKTVAEPLYDLFVRRALSKDEWKALKNYSDQLQLAFFATVGFDDEIDLLEQIHCDSIKIASADIDHYPLIKKAARTGMCIQLDTGMATLGEVETAVDIIRKEGNENIIIHQCPSGYPARLESINLNMITTLQQMFPYPVAFSDHTPGADMDIAAVALGACLLEKTITENRCTPSVEHIMSLEPQEMKPFIETIRELEIALGSNRRLITDQERKLHRKVKRSAHTIANLEKGHQITPEDIEFSRPGYGIPPGHITSVIGKKLTCSKQAGVPLTWNDFA